MKKIFKNKAIRRLVIIFGILLFLYLLAWRFLFYIPLDWVKYSNTSTSHHYSFSYPKDWVLSECGNGEVVIAKTAINKCYLPLDAPKEYLESVYFQTFLPGDNYVVYNGDVKLPDGLKDWKTITENPTDWGGYENITNIAIPMSQVNTENKTYSKQQYFILGFYPHPDVKGVYDWVINSLNYTRQ